MFNHSTSDYVCPICLGVKEVISDKTLMLPQDIVYKDDICTAFINSFWIKNNPGHVIVVPNTHYENIYDIPNDIGAQIFSVVRKISTAIKETYKCDGITLLQNNEPAGGQHAFHFHLHIFPRYENDQLHKNMDNKQLADPIQRIKYATRLRAILQGVTL